MRKILFPFYHCTLSNPPPPPTPLSPFTPQWWFVQLCPHSSCHFGCFFLLLARLECYNCNILPVKEWFKSYSREYSCCLKGQCHEIFDFRFSTLISFPQAPDYTIRAVSIFSKICGDTHSSRCKWKKSSIRKVFFISFGHLWVPEYSSHRWQICLRRCTLTCEYLPELSQYSKWAKCYFQGLGERWFMKKIWSKKSRDTVPLHGANGLSCTDI
jgi:hypothetical protein